MDEVARDAVVRQRRSREDSPRRGGAVGVGRLVWWVVAIVVTAVPLAFLAGLVVAEDRLEGVTVDAAPVLATAADLVVTDERRTNVELSWERGAPLRAPGWSGIVTEVMIEPGQELVTGDVVASVDGVDRIVAVTSMPLFRPLSVGVIGTDVEVLHELLVELGLLSAVPTVANRYTAVTRTAVIALERQLGIARPSGVFDPSWVVGLPLEPWPVSEASLEVGLPVPGLGEPIGWGPAVLTRADLTTAGGTPLELDEDTEWVVEIDGVIVPLDPALNAIVDNDDLATITPRLTANAERGAGLVRRRVAREVVQVPSTAVVADPSGGLCVFAPDGDGWTAVEVEVIGARAGASHLLPASGLPEQVLANPAQVLGAGVACR